jgi:hypothetical protein
MSNVKRSPWVLLCGALLAVACSPPPRQTWPNTFHGPGEDAFLSDDDFRCLGDARFETVGKLRVTNTLGHQKEAVAVAKGETPGPYPVGTLVSLLPDEAMVKRGQGFSPATGDWEFLRLHLGTGKTIITARGTTEVKNLGGTCISCHTPAKDSDFVCATSSKCPKLPFFINTDIHPAKDDPRCRSL